MVKYWPEKGKSGFLVWRYLLKRNDDEAAPWTRDGKERIKKLGLTMQVWRLRFTWLCVLFARLFIFCSVSQYPEGYLEAVAAKEKEKENKNEDDIEETPTKGKRKRKSQTGGWNVTTL